MHIINMRGSILSVLLPLVAIGLSVTVIAHPSAKKNSVHALSPATIELCRDVFKKAGVKNPEKISIESTDSWITAGADQTNNTFYINTERFDLFTHEEKIGILAHEAIHFRNNHHLKIMLVSFSVLPVLYALQYTFFPQSLLNPQSIVPPATQQNYSFSAILSVLHNALFTPYLPLIAGAYMLPQVAYRWHIELEATREGVRALGCCDGYLGYVSKRKTQIAAEETHMNIFRKLFNKVRFHFFHPPWSWHEHAARQGAREHNNEMPSR